MIALAWGIQMAVAGGLCAFEIKRRNPGFSVIHGTLFFVGFTQFAKALAA